MTINLPRVVWTTLTGLVIVVVSMLGAWGASVNARLQTTEERLNLVEQHYVAIETDLSAMRQDLHDMQQDVRALRGEDRH